MQGSNLAFLRELTHQMTLQDVVRTKGSDWVRYDVEHGNCIGVGLLHERSVAVQKSFMSKGTVFPKHIHDETELLVVYEGAIEVDGRQYSVSEVVRFHNGQEHTVKALEDTWLIGIIIPASSAYPDKEPDGET